MPHPLTQAIFDAVVAWLENGRSLSEDVHRYADTVLGGHDEDILREVLSPEHPDFETFAEFLLFPDAPLLYELDGILHPGENVSMHAQASGPALSHFPNTFPDTFSDAFPAEEIDRLTTMLEQAAPPCLLHMPDTAPIRFTIPGYIWRDTVRRLHLDVALSEPVRLCIARLHPAHMATRIRCSIKATHLRFEGAFEALLLAFLEHYPSGDPAYAATLAFWLHFLSSLPKSIVFPPQQGGSSAKANVTGSAEREADPWFHLHKRHQRLNKALRQSQEFTERMQRYSMDLIMMQGAQAPFVHEDEAREQIRIMERVSLAVFGRPAGFEEDMREADYGTVDPADITDVMRTLSLLDR
ncbi:MAG: hypothetical protein ACK5JO_07425 [Halodesulfovibrio sp.]